MYTVVQKTIGSVTTSSAISDFTVYMDEIAIRSCHYMKSTSVIQPALRVFLQAGATAAHAADVALLGARGWSIPQNATLCVHMHYPRSPFGHFGA